MKQIDTNVAGVAAVFAQQLLGGWGVFCAETRRPLLLAGPDVGALVDELNRREWWLVAMGWLALAR